MECSLQGEFDSACFILHFSDLCFSFGTNSQEQATTISSSSWMVGSASWSRSHEPGRYTIIGHQTGHGFQLAHCKIPSVDDFLSGAAWFGKVMVLYQSLSLRIVPLQFQTLSQPVFGVVSWALNTFSDATWSTRLLITSYIYIYIHIYI